MKDVKDYLHLYLGCECIITPHNDGIPYVPDTLTAYILTQLHRWSVKPILRPLSDMSEEEGYEIYFQYFGSKTAEDWSGDTGSAYFRPKKVQPGKYHGLRIVDGIDYSSGDFGTVIKILPFLLSKRFDLFGLINAGLAIDATKT